MSLALIPPPLSKPLSSPSASTSQPSTPISTPSEMSMDDDTSTVDLESTTVPPGQSGDIGTSPYARRRRDLLSLLARLHKTGIQKMNLDLPQIAVVGSQSVGKSSLIEAISGIKLPRAAGTCTRCPMECRLEHSDTGVWSCRVSLRVEADDGSSKDIDFGPPISQPDEVERRLRQAQRALLRRGLEPNLFLRDLDLQMPGKSLSFTNDCVCLHIQGPGVTDLHFFDLPGIIVNVQQGQDPNDINLVEDMVRRYIERPGCIVLLVVSCETDFENQVAARIVKDLDPRGERTVGVLTKPDRADAGSSLSYQQMNRKHHLSSDWFVLKLPDSIELEEGITPQEANVRASNFFRTNEHWRSYARTHADHIGTAKLTAYLADRLSAQLRQDLPRLRKEVASMLARVTREIIDLPVENKSDPTSQVFAAIMRFTTDVSAQIRGNSELVVERRGLVQRLLAAYHDFKTEIRSTVPVFDARKHAGATSKLGDLVVLGDLDCDGEDQFAIQTRKSVRIADVMTTAREARTRELPGNYPFSVKAYWIFKFLDTWSTPAIDCFDNASSIYAEELEKLIEHHFGTYAHNGLLFRVQDAVNSHLENCAVGARDQLRLAIRREQDDIFTQNDHYFYAYKAKFVAHYKLARTVTVRPPSPPAPSISRRPSPQPISYDDELWDGHDMHPGTRPSSPSPANALAALRHLNSAYSGVTAADLPKLLPADEMEPAIDIIAEVRAYFQVAYKRFIDAIPQVVEQALIRKVNQDLSTALVDGLELFGPGAREQCEAWVAEPQAVKERRNELSSQKVALLDAQLLLQRFG